MADEGIGIPVLLGRPEVIGEKIEILGLDCCPEIVDPGNFDRLDDYAQAYYDLRQRKGMTMKDARKAVREPNVFGPLMVKMGDADAFVSGLTYDYPEVIRPALQIHHTVPGVRRTAGVYIMIVNNRTYLFTDATVNIDPTAEDLAEIACPVGEFCPPARPGAAGGAAFLLEFWQHASPAIGKSSQGGRDHSQDLSRFCCGW